MHTIYYVTREESRNGLVFMGPLIVAREPDVLILLDKAINKFVAATSNESSRRTIVDGERQQVEWQTGIGAQRVDGSKTGRSNHEAKILCLVSEWCFYLPITEQDMALHSTSSVSPVELERFRTPPSPHGLLQSFQSNHWSAKVYERWVRQH